MYKVIVNDDVVQEKRRAAQVKILFHPSSLCHGIVVMSALGSTPNDSYHFSKPPHHGTRTTTAAAVFAHEFAFFGVQGDGIHGLGQLGHL